MSSTTLYLKYRPQKLEELDSEAVRESLKRIVASGKLPQAFLFAGPKGTGKTSAARIIAKILNCEKSGKRLNEPCGRCNQCISISEDSNLDVVEMDAASHRGIDDVRALREAVALAPAKAKNKIYIIDEVHMLTTEAANALLKTLEEPPAHVYFILATTNPEKLIETIRSRTTNLLFKKASSQEIVRSLGRVVKGEKIKVGNPVLALIAKAASGSFRDAVKILEQLLSEKRKLDEETVSDFLFQRKTFDIDNFLSLLAKKETRNAILEIDSAVSSGVSVGNILMGTLERLRGGLLAISGVGEETLEGFKRGEIIDLIKLFSETVKELPNAPIEELPLEVAVVEWCEGKAKVSNPLPSQDIGAKIIGEVEQKPEEIKGVTSKETVVKDVKSSQTPFQPTPSLEVIKEVSDEVWKRILATVKPINTSIEALLRAAKPLSYDGKNLTLGVFYKFHKERLEDFHHRRILEEVASEILGSVTRITCILTEPPVKKMEQLETPQKEEVVLTEGGDKDIIRVAKEIFGN